MGFAHNCNACLGSTPCKTLHTARLVSCGIPLRCVMLCYVMLCYAMVPEQEAPERPGGVIRPTQ